MTRAVLAPDAPPWVTNVVIVGYDARLSRSHIVAAFGST